MGTDADSIKYPYTPRLETSSSIAGPSVPSLPSLPYSGSATPAEPSEMAADMERDLLPHEYEERPRSPSRRTARIVRSVPGAERALRIVNTILGPSHRQTPPLPTPGIMLSATFHRKAATANLDLQTTRLSRKWRTHHLWFPYLLLWATGLILLVRAAYYLPNAPETLRCTSSFWPDWPPDYCGENGVECASGLSPGTYKCPGGCQNTPLGNPRWVGNESVNGVPLIIGGGDDAGTYRADSWVCAAGVHAGAVSPTFGGCVTVTPLDFPRGASNYIRKKGGADLWSVAFQPEFPAAFRIASAGKMGQCMEFHWPIMSYNLVLLFIFTALFTPPPAVHATVLIVLGYIQITLASNPVYRPPDWSIIMGGLIPVLLAGYWMWNVSFRTTITGFISAGLTLDMAIWQGAGFWIGIESSSLFAKIPISRLGYGTIPPAGIIALVIIIVIVVTVVVLQILAYRRLGYFRYYLKRYLPLVPILILLGNLGHGYYLRLHHYLLCLAGIPVLGLPNRISLFGQSFLLGFFLDGVGRWGWASIIEHASDLRGDAAAGTVLPLIDATKDAISWFPINQTLIDIGITAVSVLFDDVVWNEKYNASKFTIEQTKANPEVDHYLRLAYIANGTSLDFTPPLTWYAANQSWGPVPYEQPGYGPNAD